MEKTNYPRIFRREDRRVEAPERVEQKIEALLRAMTWEEKCSLLGGGREPESKGKIGNAGYQPGVPRLGIPESVMYDGPAGITGVVETTGLPCPALLGSTWDDDLAGAFGEVAARECAACSGNYLLAPQLDVIRSPHFCRNKDMKSEDSLMAARMGAAETRGAQAQGVAAVVKHFTAANLFGTSLNAFPKQYVDEQTLHETYCRSFEAAIREAGAASVMNAYNDVNGHFMSANREMLSGILREQWGFGGSVMSDWGSVHEFTLDKGMDMEMPYPAFNSRQRIERRVADGRLNPAAVDGAVRHVLRAMSTAGLLSLVKLDGGGEVMEEPGRKHPIEMAWTYDQDVADGLLDRDAEIAGEIARAGMVLLKNEGGALPMKNADGLALIGLGAKYPVCGEAQERSFGRLSRMRSGQAALGEVFGTRLPAYPGIDFAGETIPAEAFFRDAACGERGLTRTWGITDEDLRLTQGGAGLGGGGEAFVGNTQRDEDGETVDTGLESYNSRESLYPEDFPLGQFCAVDAAVDFTCGRDARGEIIQNYRNGADGTAFTDGASYTWKGWLRAPETGEYDLILQCVGGEASFLIETDAGWRLAGKSQMREWAQWPWESIVCTPEGMGITSDRVWLEAGRAYRILAIARHCVKNKDLQLRLAWVTPAMARANWDAAIDAAAKAKQIVFYVCDATMGVKASERRLAENRLELSEEQTRLLEAVITARQPCAKLIVVVQTANARAIGRWADAADAILATYMPGQEGGRAVAEILTGRVNPSGKLAQSWPRDPGDTPLTDTADHFAQRIEGFERGGALTVRMGEGIFTGYRWHDQYGVAPLFPFGHGLSYTRFAYANPEIEGAEAISLDVTNIGGVAGDEIVQLYVGAADVPEGIQMPVKQLAGYLRVKDLQPGERRRVRVAIDPRALCYWDPALPLQTRPDGTKDKWVRPAGRRRLYVGASSRDIRLEGEIDVK